MEPSADASIEDEAKFEQTALSAFLTATSVHPYATATSSCDGLINECWKRSIESKGVGTFTSRQRAGGVVEDNEERGGRGPCGTADGRAEMGGRRLGPAPARPAVPLLPDRTRHTFAQVLHPPFRRTLACALSALVVPHRSCDGLPPAPPQEAQALAARRTTKHRAPVVQRALHRCQRHQVCTCSRHV
mgnify:CR=1 FL=1